MPIRTSTPTGMAVHRDHGPLGVRGASRRSPRMASRPARDRAWSPSSATRSCLGTLYALRPRRGRAGARDAAIAFGALLPGLGRPDHGSGRRLHAPGARDLGVRVAVPVPARQAEFRLRSRWMLVFDGARYAWRRFQARLHGHEHVAPLEMSSYGARTAFGVGMIHGVGAETGSQALLIAAVGGAAGAGLGIPMLLRSSSGSSPRTRSSSWCPRPGSSRASSGSRSTSASACWPGVFSIVVGLSFLLGTESLLPDLQQLLGGWPVTEGAASGAGTRRRHVLGRRSPTGSGRAASAGPRSAGRWSRSWRRSTGHVTGAELVDRCRALDPATTPSTVYRTLDVLEDLGLRPPRPRRGRPRGVPRPAGSRPRPPPLPRLPRVLGDRRGRGRGARRARCAAAPRVRGGPVAPLGLGSVSRRATDG